MKTKAEMLEKNAPTSMEISALIATGTLAFKQKSNPRILG
jgi:hypothetical protein